MEFFLMISDDNFFPSEPKKIKERIRRYERAFKDPNHDDSAGKRFLIGPLYLLMSDITGALKFYNWYEQKFPDDGPEAFNHLCWALTLLKSEKTILAKSKLRELIFENLYIVPLLIGETPKQHSFWHGSNSHEPSWILDGPRVELFSLWGDSELSWAKNEWKNPLIVKDIARFIELRKLLDQTDLREERGEILKQAGIIARGE